MSASWTDFSKPEVVLATVAIVLAIVAIAFAIIQFADAKLQNRKLRQVAGSMSTRYIGEFPKNMAEIVDVVRRAHAKLDIVVDLAAYGHYSDPLQFKGYLDAICEKCRQGVQVRMVIYESNLYAQYFNRQFPKDLFSKETQSERFAFFFYRGRPKPATWEAFCKLMEHEQMEHLTHMTKAGVRVRSLSTEILLSLWLEDREDVVFSFQNATERERELSFRTRDGNLVSSLQRMFESIWEQSADYDRSI
jgi:hypothetical protein